MNLTQLTSQIVLMFILMLVGLLVNKLGFMHAQTSTDLTNILLYIVSPCLIIQAFEQSFSADRLQLLARVIVGIIIIYIIMIIVTQLLFKPVADPNLRRIMRYGSVYSNAGFMGIPLTSSLFGATGVFFAVASLAAFNIFSWTHGISLFTGRQGNRRENFKQIVLNPNIIAIVVGLILFVTSFRLPTIANSAIKYVSSVNTPLSMIVIGNSLADVKLNRATLDKRLWWVLLLRNLLFPYLAIVADGNHRCAAVYDRVDGRLPSCRHRRLIFAESPWQPRPRGRTHEYFNNFKCCHDSNRLCTGKLTLVLATS